MSNLIAKGWEAEISSRVLRIASALQSAGVDAILISSNANIYYASSRIIAGYVYITKEGDSTYFVRRPVGLEGKNVVYIRKPEQIVETLGKVPGVLALEYDMSYSDIMRLQKAFDGAKIVDGSAIMRGMRAVKSEFEIELIRRSGVCHAEAYSAIPKIYSEGMSDIEFQVEIEHR